MQAPIGPAATVELAAAVCAADGLGSLASSWTRTDVLRAQVRALTGRRFCVNLVLAFPQEHRLDVLCEEHVPVISFSWGIRPDLVARAQEAGGEVLIQVGSAAAARRAVDAGADAVAAGTAFLVAEEADRHPGYVERLLAAEDAVLTDVFSIGWPDAKHRVLPNAALAEGAPASEAMPTGTRGGDPDRMALYAGAGVRALRRVEPAAAIVDRLRLEPCGP